VSETPRAIDLAEYVKQKDAAKTNVKMFPLVTVGMPFLQDPSKVQEQEQLRAEAMEAIADVMRKFRLWRVDAVLGLVQVEEKPGA
jgi:hypothetical protein